MADVMALTLFCRVCDSPNEFPRNWVDDTDECTACGAKKQWRTVNEPKVAWDVSHNDRRFLKALRIKSDDEA